MEIKLTNGCLIPIKIGIVKRLLLIMMRTFIFVFCTTVFSLNSEIGMSQIMVKIDADKEVSVDEVFDIIKAQTEFSFIYPQDLFKDMAKVHLKKGMIRMDKLINESIKDGNLNVILSTDNTILIKEATPVQQRQISGKVTDEKNVPVPGVTVLIKGTAKGTVSELDGSYTIIVPNPENVLVFSALGFATQEITVGNQSTINIALKESLNELEVVTINAGYYKVKQREATGNISRVDAKIIEKQPVSNPLAAMQGHLSGVNIVQSTGVPGGGYKIEIRGKNFINGGTDPLFIIDGMPFGSESLETGALGSSINGANVSPLNAINPADIESIEVLKDADATAIYGSRGANGVVLITTKKGKAGKTQFKANVSSTLGNITRFKELLNTEQYLELRTEAFYGDNFQSFLLNPVYDFAWPDLKTWDQNRYTDWQKELIGGTAYRNNAQLSVSGGNNQTQFLVSGGYQKETTVFPGDSNYKKGAFRSNINHHSNDQRFLINLSTSYTMEDNQLPLADFTNLANTIAPNAPALYDEEGNLNWENNTFDNPLATLEREYRAKVNTFMANTVLSYQLTSRLDLKTNLGYNNYQYGSYTTFPNTAFNPSLGYNSSRSSFSTNNSNRQSWILEPQINWQQQWGDTKLNILVGSTFQKQTTQQFVQRGTGFSSNSLILNLSAAETLEVLLDANSEYNYQAFFGRINFNWKNKYILNLTGRRDGSSRFGPGNQFGNFGAIGVAWLFSEEIFLKDNRVFSFGKLRGSYGTTGSDNIGDYRFLDTYSITGYDYNGVMAMGPTGIFNPIYGWEENKKLEVALELGFFNDQIFLNASWYQNRSSNQLIGLPLPATTGFSSFTGNFDATVENTGFEVDLNTTNIKKDYFTWTTSFNLTVPKNKLLEFPGLESSAFANRYRIGKPLTAIPLYHALGVDPETGLYQFEDYNDDGSITSSNDKKWFEDLAPKFYGGLGNILTYKNVSLDIFFQFKKQKGYNNFYTRASAGFSGNGPIQLINRWQESGDNAPVQRATLGRLPGAGIAGQNQSSSNAAVSDASFIRLRNISLSYNVPKTFSHGMDLTVYLQGQNLLTITNYQNADPEQPLSHVLPPLRQITLGINLGF